MDAVDIKRAAESRPLTWRDTFDSRSRHAIGKSQQSSKLGPFNELININIIITIIIVRLAVVVVVVIKEPNQFPIWAPNEIRWVAPLASLVGLAADPGR